MKFWTFVTSVKRCTKAEFSSIHSEGLGSTEPEPTSSGSAPSPATCESHLRCSTDLIETWPRTLLTAHTAPPWCQRVLSYKSDHPRDELNMGRIDLNRPWLKFAPYMYIYIHIDIYIYYIYMYDIWLKYQINIPFTHLISILGCLMSTHSHMEPITVFSELEPTQTPTFPAFAPSSAVSSGYVNPGSTWSLRHLFKEKCSSLKICPILCCRCSDLNIYEHN